MASYPLFIISDFFCIFQMNFAMATLGLKEMGKNSFGKLRKSLPSWPKLRQPTGQTFFSTFPKEFSHFLQTKVAMHLSLKNLLLKGKRSPFYLNHILSKIYNVQQRISIIIESILHQTYSMHILISYLRLI